MTQSLPTAVPARTEPVSTLTGETEPRPLPRVAEIPGFVEYMGRGWGTPDRTAPVAPGTASATAAHRARLAAEFPGRWIVVPAGRAPVRSNDTAYDFRPGSDFVWLTGCPVQDAVLILGPAEATVYVPPPAYPGERDFFASAATGELWVGAAPGLSDWAEALGLTVRPLSELADAVARLSDPLRPGVPEFDRAVAELRMIKTSGRSASCGRR